MARISITAPSSAEEGERVSASVRVWNNTEYYAWFKGDIEALPALYPGYVIGSIDKVLGPGSSVTRSVSFTMPDCDVTVFIWLERWGEFEDDWVYDSSASKVVSLEVVPPPPRPPACSISIDAPASAEEGEKVSVSALIKNVSDISIVYKIELYGVPDLFPDFRIGTIEKKIDSGATFTAYGSFTMPASDISILAWVELWWEGKWEYDKAESEVISLEVVPEYRGTINRKELEYDEARGAIPVY